MTSGHMIRVPRTELGGWIEIVWPEDAIAGPDSGASSIGELHRSACDTFLLTLPHCGADSSSTPGGNVIKSRSYHSLVETVATTVGKIQGLPDVLLLGARTILDELLRASGCFVQNPVDGRMGVALNDRTLPGFVSFTAESCGVGERTREEIARLVALQKDGRSAGEGVVDFLRREVGRRTWCAEDRPGINVLVDIAEHASAPRIGVRNNGAGPLAPSPQSAAFWGAVSGAASRPLGWASVLISATCSIAASSLDDMSDGSEDETEPFTA